MQDFEITNISSKNSDLRIGGIISSIKLLFDKRNNQWAIITLDRMSTRSEIFIFNDLYEQRKDLIQDNALLFISGKLSNRQSDDDDVLKIIAEDIINMNQVRAKFSKHIHIKIEYHHNDNSILNSIKSLAQSNQGNCRLILNIETSSGYIHKIVSQDLNVSPSADFIQSLRDILGEKNVWIAS